MIKKLLKDGFALKNKGHYKHAIEIFYKVLEEDNTSTELLLEIADLYYKINNEEKALSYIEQILDKSPSHIKALKLLENIFINKKAYEEAEQTAKNIYCFSEKAEDLAQILRLLNIQGKFEEVFEYKTCHKNDKILKEQAYAMFYTHNYPKAQELLEQIDNKDTNTIILLGKSLLAQKKQDKCAQLLEQISENTKDAELLNLRGLIDEFQENYQSSKKHFQQAIKLNPQNDEYYFNLANIYFRQGDIQYARKYYTLAISINPESNNYHFALANLYYSQKHYKRALEELQDDFFEGNLLKAIILYETGYLALAKLELNKLAEEKPDNEIIINYQNRIKEDLSLT